MLQNARVISFTISELLKENEQDGMGRGRGGGGGGGGWGVNLQLPVTATEFNCTLFCRQNTLKKLSRNLI